ncbi:MAG: hypothetical protein OFPII_17560 [Osedax symbiont Rs1]|nr:MAG: hypothetical protein OFPII_17560 [Osedax symbiont Rs1]
MSEYQYYEFRTCDQSLSSVQRSELRAISSRAQITNNRFMNEYHWGSLKATPSEMLQQYFDVGLYLSNFGCADFYIKIPQQAIPSKTLALFSLENVFSYHAYANHWILCFSLPECDDYLEPDDDIYHKLEELTSIREELIKGDYRSLYIPIMAYLTHDNSAEIAIAKLDLSLASYSTAQQSLIELLLVDSIWPAVFSQVFSDNKESPLENKHLQQHWIRSIPVEQLQHLLEQVMTGDGIVIQQQLNMAYQKTLAVQHSTYLDLATLKKTYHKCEILQRQQQRQQAELLQQKVLAERQKHLAFVYLERASYWKQAAQEAVKSTGASYDRAVRILDDLMHCYQLQQNNAEYKQQLITFLQPLQRKKSLLAKLQKRGLDRPC